MLTITGDTGILSVGTAGCDNIAIMDTGEQRGLGAKTDQTIQKYVSCALPILCIGIVRCNPCSVDEMGVWLYCMNYIMVGFRDVGVATSAHLRSQAAYTQQRQHLNPSHILHIWYPMHYCSTSLHGHNQRPGLILSQQDEQLHLGSYLGNIT